MTHDWVRAAAQEIIVEDFVGEQPAFRLAVQRTAIKERLAEIIYQHWLSVTTVGVAERHVPIPRELSADEVEQLLITGSLPDGSARLGPGAAERVVELVVQLRATGAHSFRSGR